MTNDIANDVLFLPFVRPDAPKLHLVGDDGTSYKGNQQCRVISIVRKL